MRSKVILENVPKIGYGIHFCPFPGSLYAYLEYMGEKCDYDYIMGVTGAAFRRLWNRDDGGNIDLSYLGETPFKHVFNALGYEYQIIPAEKDAMIEAIKESINKGRPLISFGIIGPPEAGLVAGYDQDGKVLYGWSYFQENNSKYYEKNDWFETMDKNAGKGLIVIGNKSQTRLSNREILIDSLKYAIDLERTAKRSDLPNHVSGLSAYEAWAKGLETDDDYPKDNQKILETRAMVHGDQCVMLEERRSAGKFLRNMAEIAPEISDQLNIAAKLYDEIADQGKYLWRWGHPMDPKVGQALADPKTRQEMAQHIRIAGEKEANAVEHLSKALTILKNKKEITNMEPKFVEKEAFNVMGFSLRGNPMSEEEYMDHEGAWREFMKHYEKVKIFSTDNGYYGVYFGVEGEEGMMELIAGMAVSNVEKVPDGLVIREVPKAYYAVFESKLKTIAQTYNYIFQEWLPKSEYEYDDYYTKPNFEFYPPDYSPDFSTGGSSLFIHVPIKAK